MLGLKLATDPRWVNLATISLEEILTDHAWCEQKAATTCISLIQAHPDKENLVRQVAPVVAEEWAHFRAVVSELDKRGLKLGRQRKDEYVNSLMTFGIKTGNQQLKLVDKLLLCALIEARSCERFRLLSIGLEEESLKKFYHKFMVSEAGHYRLFIDLAIEYGPNENYVRQRWQQWLDFESHILAEMTPRGDRMH
jgi:tRNA-(ms[2]io[6]A)-hydroxylase